MKRLVLIAGMLLCFCLQGFADQIVLKNGDRLSGTIIKSDGKALVIKTDYAGEVTVQFAAIDQITSTQPLHLTLKDGKTVAGPVATADGNVVVATGGSGAVTSPKAEIVTIRDDAEQAAYVKALHPGLTSGWAGGVNVGFALTRGNSETKNLNLAFHALRKTSNDQIKVYLNSVYATNDAPGATPAITADAIQSGARYDRNINPRTFGYGSGDFQTDDLQNLNLRSVLGAGFGYHAMKSGSTTIDLMGGINYTHESYTEFSRSFPAATLGEDLTYKWKPNTVLTQSLYFFPDLTDGGEYRATFNFGAVTKIKKWLGWQLAFGDIYVTNPPAGKKQNDILFTTGLNFSFVH
jgi:putative salt-induced outer membrane protein YdiY